MEDPAAITSSAVVVGVAAAARVPAAAPSAPSAAVATAPPVPQPPPEQLAAAGLQRQVFSVELRHGETTIVSWKKLLKEAGHTGAFSPPAPVAASEPAFASHAGLSGEAHPAENEPKDPAQPNRFSAVIEKIERLYMGKHSSDEEDLDDVPDDDQYDTEDSFIDDTELDEYFEVDNLATKHNGYFVNKGKLEQIEPGTSTNVAPKKRRRKDASSTCIENNQVAPGDHLSIGNMPAKASARSVSQVGKKLAGSNLGSYGENYYEDNRAVKNKINAPEGTPKKKSTDFAVGTNTAAHLKTSSKEVPLAPSELKDFEKHKASAFQSVDFAHKSRTSETYGYTYAAYRDKDVPTQLDFQQKKAFSEQDLSNKVHRKEKHGIGEFPGTTASGTVYSTQVTHPVTAREGSGTKAKGTRLERAIRDLQKIVAAYRPPTLDVHEVDPNCQASVKRRLPQEVKQKLAKVARLSSVQASQGKISEHELIDRLMGIVGHLVQRRTLKKNMKEMVESGLSAKQEKADRFQQVKMEINEMIKARVGTMYKGTEQPDGSADDFQDVVTDERRALKGKSFMDTALEDRICDLYDLYVEGMDEDKGPQSRKLYVELAELWPQGYMDNVGVKDAISRSKERRRLLYSQQKVRNEERLKRKRLAAAAKLQDGNPAVVQTVLVPQVQPSISNSIIAYPVIDYGQNQGLKSVDRVREIGPGAISNDSNRNVGETKKKKRKSESDTVDIQANPLKAPQQHGNEKQKPPKHADDANVSSLASKASVPILGLPSYDQQPS